MANEALRTAISTPVAAGRGLPLGENLVKKSGVKVDGCANAAYFGHRHQGTTPFAPESRFWSLNEIDGINSSSDFTPGTVIMFRASSDLIR